MILELLLYHKSGSACIYTAIFHHGDLSLLSTYFLIQPILPRSMMYKSNNAIIKCSTTIK